MLEARAFVKEIKDAREILEKNNAVFKGEYICHDFIYSSTDGKSLAEEYLRFRINEKNIWDEKDFIVAIKQTYKNRIGKDSIFPMKKEFDNEQSARDFIKNNLSDKYKFNFEFKRIGWQYYLGDDCVDLEKVLDVEDCYTMEIKSQTEEGLERLAQIFNLTELIEGPSVVAIRSLLASSSK